MAPQSRGPLPNPHALSSLPPLDESALLSPDEQTPTRPTYAKHLGYPPLAQDLDLQDDDSLDLQAQYSLSGDSSSSSSSSKDSLSQTDIPNGTRPYLHQSNSSLLIANAFAPPFYNKPPTPLPPSPSLTSLLRPSFSTTTSRPTTPDSSDNDTPNDTEAAVAKSARTATTVPRASPKVPTYEYYGFVLYLASSLAFCVSPLPFLPILATDTENSNIPPLVLPPLPFPPPTRNLLLPQPLVVSRNSLFPSYDYCLHIRRTRKL